MNEAREKVESFKKKGNFQDLVKTSLDVKLPENYKSLSFREQNRVLEESNDDAIARHIGVVLTDKEDWPDERSLNDAKAWAKTLPDA